MSFKLDLVFIVFATLLSLHAEAQTRSALTAGIEHFLCAQDRWGELKLNQAQFRKLEIGIMTEGEKWEVGTSGDILGGTTTAGNSYLSLVNLGERDAAVYVFEAVFPGNNSSYANDKLALFKRSPKFYMYMTHQTCDSLWRHEKPPEETVRATVKMAFRNHLLAWGIPYRRVVLCKFYTDDPYAVALSYWKGSSPTAYEVNLYASEDSRPLDQRGKDDFLTSPGHRISPKALRRCPG